MPITWTPLMPDNVLPLPQPTSSTTDPGWRSIECLGAPFHNAPLVEYSLSHILPRCSALISSGIGFFLSPTDRFDKPTRRAVNISRLPTFVLQMNSKAAEVLRGLDEAGFKGRIVPAHRVADVGRDILSLKEQGLLESEFYGMYMSKYSYGPPETFPSARSIIVVAVPTKALSLTFCHGGKEHRCLVPPTYANAVDIDKQVRSVLQGALADGKFVKALLPYKTLAARTGLAKYGKNNITYAEGCGSYHRLTGFFTDADLETDHWQEREVMAQCTDCDLCRRACPTGAIPKDRFLVRADRCLTFHNEMPAERKFPTSMKRSVHHALVGCMRCQDACPLNQADQCSVAEGDIYSESETDYLLKGDYQNDDAEEIMEKLDRSGLDLAIFPRNLAVLLESPRDR